MGRRNARTLSVSAAVVLLGVLIVWQLGEPARACPDTKPELKGHARARPDPMWQVVEEVAAHSDPSSAIARDARSGPDAAIRIAAEHIGLTDLDGIEICVRRVIPEGDTTPFLSHLINGRECYAVRFSGLEIKLPLGEEDDEIISAVHGLNALIDAESGKLFRVWSTEWLDPQSMKRSVSESEANINRENGARWMGFPEAPPSVGLLEALYDRSLRLSSLMEQLDAYYVVHESRAAPQLETDSQELGEASAEERAPIVVTRATWQMVVRQQIPFLPHGGPEQVEPYPVYGLRLTVDAETGEFLGGVNFY